MLWRVRRISVCTLLVKWVKFKLIYCQSPSKSVVFYMHTSKMGSHRANREGKKLAPCITHESYISQTANSAICLSGKTNKQMGAPREEWWITLTSYIIFVTFPNSTNTETTAWTKFCSLWGKLQYFVQVKNLQTWIFWKRCRVLWTSTGEERQNENNSLVFIGAVLQVLGICADSRDWESWKHWKHTQPDCYTITNIQLKQLKHADIRTDILYASFTEKNSHFSLKSFIPNTNI